MLWNGFKCDEFDFEGFPAMVISPHNRAENPALILKTEYFGAFPETEIELLESGQYLGFVKNENRWGLASDIERKARFVSFVSEKYSLNGKCVPVGMSCGGIFAVKLAALFPEKVACIYLDAPVVNYMSCPCGFGEGNSLNGTNDEIMQALSFNEIGELLAYREMPLDYIGRLIENRIPAILVAGDSDKTVPYRENGIFIERAYKAADIDFEVYIKPGCDHHPHGLENPGTAVNFILKELN